MVRDNRNPVMRVLIFSISLALIILMLLYTTTIYFIGQSELFTNLLLFLTLASLVLLISSQVKGLSVNGVKKLVGG